MLTVWAALESMAARLATTNASDDDIRSLRDLFREFEKKKPAEHVSEYSDANLAFHKKIVGMSGNDLIVDMTDNLFIHMRAIRKLHIGQDNRPERSIVDHKTILAHLSNRDNDLAERLVMTPQQCLATQHHKQSN